MLKFYIAVFTLLLANACGAKNDQNDEMTSNKNLSTVPTEIVFCPETSESEAREILLLGSIKQVQVDTLLGQLRTANISYEISNNSPFRCHELEVLSDDKIYMIDGGWSDDKSHKRGYNVVASSNGNVRFIEERHSYKPPKLWSD